MPTKPKKKGLVVEVETPPYPSKYLNVRVPGDNYVLCKTMVRKAGVTKPGKYRVTFTPEPETKGQK